MYSHESDWPSVSRYIEFLIYSHCIPAIGITVVDLAREEPLLERVFHHREVRTPIPSIRYSQYNVASVSKLVTYLALLKLVEQGKVALGDPVSKFYPGFAPVRSRREESPINAEKELPEITVFNLIRHTSGMIREPLEGNYFNEVQCSLEDLVESMTRSTAELPPGYVHKYSNAAVAVAGYVVQVASGQSFEDYIQNEVLAPLGMDHATFKDTYNHYTVNEDGTNIRVAPGHMWKYWDESLNDLGVYTEAPLTKFGMNPASGMQCSLEEMARLIRLFLNYGEPLISKAQFMQFITPQPLEHPVPGSATVEFRAGMPSHGLGPEITQTYGYLTARHGGAINGFASEFRVIPELGIGLYAVSTLDCTNSVVQDIAKFVYATLVPKYAQPHHTAVRSLPIDQIHSTCASDCEYYDSVMNKQCKYPLDQAKVARVSGLYKLPNMSDAQKDDDNAMAKIYQEYNGNMVVKGTTKARVSVLKHGQAERLITFDRLSCNAELIPDISKPALSFLGLDRDDTQSNNNLDYLPYTPLPDKRQIQALQPPPREVDALLQPLVGIYTAKDHSTVVYEEDGSLFMGIEWFFLYKLRYLEHSASTITFSCSPYAMYNYEIVVFHFEGGVGGRPHRMELSGIPFFYKAFGNTGKQEGVCEDSVIANAIERSKTVAFHLPVAEEHNLVDLEGVSDTFKFDIKYASKDNFSGHVLYPSARSFLNKEAAKCLKSAHDWLVENFNLGIIIYDTYRPWSVTWAMAESVCEEFRGFYVADPKIGSVHNRGGAVDISLYDIATGQAVDMPSDFDELSYRSHRSYLGGTSKQRWHRKLLTMALMNNNFTPYPQEWWHFDFNSVVPLPVLNIQFDQIQ